MTALSYPQRDGRKAGGAGDSPPSPLSPFAADGKCRCCGGLGEHFRTCPHATWEKREL